MKKRYTAEQIRNKYGGMEVSERPAAQDPGKRKRQAQEAWPSSSWSSRDSRSSPEKNVPGRPARGIGGAYEPGRVEPRGLPLSRF